MRLMAGVLVACAIAAPMTVVQAAKPGPANWGCSVQFRDDAADTVRSDGLGTYVDGVSGVSCTIDKFNGWLYLSFTNKSKRALAFVGQQNVEGDFTYTTVTSKAVSLEIKTLASVVDVQDVRPWRGRVWDPQFQGGYGQFSGDSNFTAGPILAGTSSLFVTPTDACTWMVTSYTTGLGPQVLPNGEMGGTQTDPRVVLFNEVGVPDYEGSVLRGHFTMPFQATIRVLSGKPGCPL